MDRQKLEALLHSIKSGETDINDAMKQLRHFQFHDTGSAKVDCDRRHRCGIPEVVFCSNKTEKQVLEIFRKLESENGSALGTRASAKQFEAIKEFFSDARYNEMAKTISLRKAGPENKGMVAVVCAGTSDIPVAEEAKETLLFLGTGVEPIYDVGVAGVHRFFAHLDKLSEASAIIAIAGMEGALPSLIGGVVDVPVIACPTSVGYGANLGGIAAMLAMINSCTPGVSVVNIDDGFGAACVAHLININEKGAKKE